MPTIYGYLHALTRAGNREASDETLSPESSADLITQVCAAHEIFGEYQGEKLENRIGWTLKTFNSLTPLMGEDENDLYGGPYPYPFYIFINKLSGNIIVGSFRYSISNAIVSHLNHSLSRELNKTLQRFSFDIEEIRKSLEDGKTLKLKPHGTDEDTQDSGRELSLFASLLQLDVNQFSSKIESVSVSGDDVLGVDFLNRFEPGTFQARQIGLRVSSSSLESCKLQAAGGMQFYSSRLRDLELCLGYVHQVGAVISD